MGEELARALAELLPRLEHRGLAFRLGLLLGRYRLDPAVRGALLRALAGGPALAREMAPLACYGVRGDREVAAALAAGFRNAALAPADRASLAFAADRASLAFVTPTCSSARSVIA